MRILVHSGFFATTKIHENRGGEEEGYILTTSSRLLLKDSSTSLTTTVLAMLDPELITPWFSLSDCFQGNELTAFETYHGITFWEYGKQNLEFNNLLNEAMACDSQLVSLIVKNHKEMFEGVASLVDVGGGTGTLARTISDAYPHMKCTVLDLPQVVANLPESKNVKFVAGDMFQSIPSAEAVLIKSVLHNWSDEACVKILKQCREAIASTDKGGKLIIIEMVINEKKDESNNQLAETKLFADLQMMLADKRDVSIALTVIASNTTAATFLATISLTLSSLIGAWLGNPSNNIFQSELVYGDTRPSTISIKYLCLLTCFLLAFSCFVQSARHFVHANYLISTPDSDIPVKNVEVAIIRGGDFWPLGLRALYFALDLLLWFFGPIPMFVSSVIMVIVLRYLDTNSTPLHRYRPPESQMVKRVGDRLSEAAVDIEELLVR
ncbi:hypothetical protein GH714_002745 [Hevea brasiliensis]|uniref:Uncharacterized protein n=1 Tax=Hevea brasiliensis TaxID=3981 RepID=A0A6A6LUM2_HEVBR|nr:hypothetical protein GH714_002745 [Hevea brasiliensis]